MHGGAIQVLKCKRTLWPMHMSGVPEATVKLVGNRVRVRWTMHWLKVGVRVRAMLWGLQRKDKAKPMTS